MSNPLYRAERCRDLAEGMSERYSSRAEAEELGTLAYGH